MPGRQKILCFFLPSLAKVNQVYYYSLHMSKDYEVLKKRIDAELFRLTQERGIRGWNTMDLAEAVGVSKRTLYKIVPSKEGLLLDVVRQNIAETQRSLAARIDDSVGVGEGLNTIAREFPRLLTNMRPEVFQQIYRTYPQIEERIAEGHDLPGAPIIAVFRNISRPADASIVGIGGPVFISD